MKKLMIIIVLLLLTVAQVWAQDKVMQVHRGGVVYEISTAQVDSITFKSHEPMEIPFMEYSLVGTSCQWAWANIEFSKAIVINSNKELEEYIVCTDGSPEIDFLNQTLLLARGTTTNGISDITKSLQQFSTDEYILNVRITVDMTMIAEGWFVVLVVEKISEDSDVELNVTII